MKRRGVIRHLESNGCALIREGSRHSWWGHQANNTRSAVPRHSELDDFLVGKICKDLRIPKP